ncbi:MAG: DUF2092 domain-containing protein [Candidatus Hydrogenedentes bacterium]|nr:DUF2092 domain-containing protein [Candidatus Hydrogenedentota bacterium]
MSIQKARFAVPLVIAALLAFVSPASLAQNAEQGSKIAPEAKKVIDALGEYYKGLKSFTVDETTEMVMEAQGMKQTMNSDYAVAIERPNKVSRILKEGMMGATIVSDGKTLYTYLPMFKKYTQEDAPETAFDAVAGEAAMFSGQFSILSASLVSDDPSAAILEGVNEATLVGVEDVEGVKCSHIKLIQEEIDIDMYVQTGDKPLLIKIVPDMAKALATAGDRMPVKDMKMSVNVRYANWTVNEPIPAEKFSFTPPEGAAKADSLMAMLGREEQEESPLLGKPAPAFSLDLIDGGKAELAPHKDKKVVVLDFWATWCGPCKKALPTIIKVTDEYKDKGVVFYAMNQREDADTIKTFLTESELACPVALDKDGSVGDLFGVSGIPQTVIIGKDGSVQSVHVGLIPNLEQTLRKELDTLLSGKNLVEAPTEGEGAAPKEGAPKA